MFTPFLLFFFFNDTATTEIYTLSLHDALPIYALDVDGVDAVELGLADFEHGAVAVRPARVVDEGVEPAMRLQRGLHQGLDLFAACHVRLHEKCPAAFGGDGPGPARARPPVGGVCGDPGPFRGR